MIPTIILTVFFNWRRGAVRSRLRPQSRFFLSCESLDIALHMHQIVQRNAPPNMGNNYAMQPTMLFVQLIQTVQHSIVRTQQSQNSSSSARHRNSMKASEDSPEAPLGFGEGIRNWRLSNPSSSIRRDVFVELCKARRVLEMCANL